VGGVGAGPGGGGGGFGGGGAKQLGILHTNATSLGNPLMTNVLQAVPR
jgi:hypothetical protein